MIYSVQKLLSARLTSLLTFGLLLNLLVPLNAHANQSFVACIKSSGEVRLITSDKKCTKKEKRTKITITPEVSTSLTGPTGPQGPIGETGPAGPKGDTGAIGPKGDTGAVGPVGPAGTTGASGVKGASTLTGVGVPANSLGENGDTYIDKNSAMIYGPKTNGVWGYGISFAGPAGAQGPAGPRGESGTAGAAGTNGLGLMNNLPSNFNQLFAIDELGSGCCDLGNENLIITVQFRNVTEYTISGMNANHTVVQYLSNVWLNFYDANGERLFEAEDDSAFSPYIASITTAWNGGVNWLAGHEKEWIINLENLYANKPAQAKYVSVTFRLQGLTTVDTSQTPWLPIGVVGNGFRIDGKDLLITRFAATAFTN